jgi:hypothetical protein
VYVESKDPLQGRVIIDATLARLEALTINEINAAYSQWRLVDILSQTSFTEKTWQAVEAVIDRKGWPVDAVKDKLVKLMAALETRNRKIAALWLDALKAHNS